MNVNIHEAKTHLSRLLKAAEQGEDVVICRDGAPVARLVPVRSTSRPVGIWKGQGWIADDFDDLPPEVEGAFYDPVD
jgi:prevent-host-death family protein